MSRQNSPIAPSKQPYSAVIFTSRRTQCDDGYHAMAEKMSDLVKRQSGFLGQYSHHDENGVGVTISYFRDEDSILAWKDNIEHLAAQRLGQERWYEQYAVKIARVERAYEWRRKPD